MSAVVPRPRLSGLTKEFYAWIARGELRVQRCLDCGQRRHLPRYLCPQCASDRWEWATTAGIGRLLSWTVTERPLHPAFPDTPFAVALVELDEGPRIIAPLVDVAFGALHGGLPVTAVCQPVDDDLGLLRFAPVAAQDGEVA